MTGQIGIFHLCCSAFLLFSSSFDLRSSSGEKVFKEKKSIFRKFLKIKKNIFSCVEKLHEYVICYTKSNVKCTVGVTKWLVDWKTFSDPVRTEKKTFLIYISATTWNQSSQRYIKAYGRNNSVKTKIKVFI